MRFSILALGAFAAIAAAQTPTPTTAPAATVSVDPAQTSLQAAIAECLKGCAAGDVNCQAKCVPVPSPNESQVNQTNQCVAACPKGSGSAADSDTYSKCVTDCISKFYYTAGAPGSQPTGASGGGSGSGSGSGSGNGGNNGATGTGGSNGATGTGTGQGGQQTTSTKNAGEIVRVGGSAVGLLGFLAAFVAL